MKGDMEGWMKMNEELDKTSENMQSIVKENKLEIAVLCCILLIITWLGDRLVADFVTTLPPKSLLRASDTVIHGLIAAVSWRMVCLINPQLSFSICFPSHWKDNFKCAGSQESSSFFSLLNFYNMGMAFAVASAVDLDHIITDLSYTLQGYELTHWQRGHDIRDALHHGLWFQPLGVTPRFPYWLYVLSTMLLPFISSGMGSLPVRPQSAHMPSVSLV